MNHRARVLLSSAMRALSVLIVLVVQLGGALHMSQVRHATCAEHGESVELSREATTTVAPHAFVVSDEDHVAHEHCGLSALLRQRGLATARATSLGPLELRTQRTSLFRITPPPPSISLLALAPKMSPTA